MPIIIDLVYLLVLAALSPWLAWRSLATGRYRRDLVAKLTGAVHVANPGRRRVAWFHGVSLGEIQLLGVLVPAFRKRHPDWLVVVSSTTDTGLAEARKRFADLDVIAWPFDFSWAIGTALDRVTPGVLILAESELWPNTLRAAQARRIPVVVANGRMSPRSHRRLTQFAGLVRPLLLNRVTHFAMQDHDYADRLRSLGVAASRITVTGSMKYDGASGDRDTAKGHELQRALGLTADHAELVWLAGSTHAPEEAIVLRVFVRLRELCPALRLILVPRHPDRFEEVASLLAASGLPFVRRSRITEPLPAMPAILLLDTVGELGAAWGLADLGFTGGSFDGVRGGQSMIEPAGYGVPCLFGPHVWNFKDAARRLVEVGGAIMVADESELERELAALIDDRERRTRMGQAARELVRQQQGATERTLEVIDAVDSGRDRTPRKRVWPISFTLR